MSKNGNQLWQLILTHTHKIAMFAVGATIALHETLLGNIERPFLLALAGGLMGLPFVLSADQKRSKGGEREG